jgi:ribosomal protein S18 acetylase RimI-like enzyme
MGSFEHAFYKSNFYSYITSNSDLIKVSEEPSGLLSGFVIGYISNPQKAKIQALFVSSDYRNQGLGTNLLRSLENYMIAKYPSLRYLSVRIPEEFFSSKSFFLSRNFLPIAKINSYIKNNLDFPFPVNREVSVRKAKKSDIKEIISIEKACFSDYWQMNAEKFKQIMKNSREILFVAIWDKNIVGYNFNAVSRTDQSGNYVRIATRPDLRQKRIATTLTAEAFKWFRLKFVDRVILSTYADSFSHNEMYRKWGFRKNEQEIILARNFDKF